MSQYEAFLRALANPEDNDTRLVYAGSRRSRIAGFWMAGNWGIGVTKRQASAD